MVEVEFWRLFATISATMIGLVFLGTFYYLESGWQTFNFFQTQMEELTVNYAKIVIAYFSSSLILSLVQEPVFPHVLPTVGVVIIAVGAMVATHSLNGSLESFRSLTDSNLLLWNQRANWVWFTAVFLGPIFRFEFVFRVPDLGDILVGEQTIAWIVFLSLILGYWNLILFLLTPFQMHKIERDKEAQENKKKELENNSPEEPTWDDSRVEIAEKRISDTLQDSGLKRRPTVEIEESYKTNTELSADLAEPIILYPPDVDDHGEVSIHVLISDDWHADIDILHRAALLAHIVGHVAISAYRDLTGVEVRVHRQYLKPWDDSEDEVVLLKARWTGRDMDSLSTKLRTTDEILESASDTVLHSTLYPLGLMGHDFEPSEREPSADEDYSYYDIEDKSTGIAKRYEARVILDPGLSKNLIRDLIPELVREVRKKDVHRNTQSEEKWSGKNADVVWLHLFNESRKPREMISIGSMDHFVGDAEWFSEDLNSKYRPMEMRNPDETVEGIRIQWSDSF